MNKKQNNEENPSSIQTFHSHSETTNKVKVEPKKYFADKIKKEIENYENSVIKKPASC